MAGSETAWRRFWNRGTWWKALLLVVVYWGVYQLLGLGISTVFAGLIDHGDPLATPASIFFAIALPILVAGLLLVVLAWSLGWLRELFGPQPIRGRGWMWIAVVLVLVPVVLRLIGTNWSAYSATRVLSVLFLGLCVGFAEELLTRGFVVTILRKGGYGERTVYLVSSLIFALLHAGNAITGQGILTVGVTVLYAFGFGAMMYLAMRLTGSLIWPILLHAATDPTTILATGGIDSSNGDTAGAGGLISVAGIFLYLYLALAIVAIFLVKNRDRVFPRHDRDQGAYPAA